MLELNPCMGLPAPPLQQKAGCQGQCCTWRGQGTLRGIDVGGMVAVAPAQAHDSAVLQVERLRPSAASPPRFSAEEMCHRFVYRDNYALRAKTQQLFLEPLFAHGKDMDATPSKAEQRAATLRRMARLARQLPISVSDLMNEPNRLFAFFESFVTLDAALMLQLTTHLVLFGGAILRLGTEEHLRTYIPAVESHSLIGCVAYSELGHGSNVKDIETTATYDSEREEFVIHTPSETAQKSWVTGGLTLATVAVVFAQLYITGVCHGVHCFVVHIRQPDGSLTPGVTVKPSGRKAGVPELDMGSMWFSSVRVPRSSLLNKYGSVTPRGTYFSPLSSPAKRLRKFLGENVMSRMIASIGAVLAARSGLRIAVSYSLERRQFGPQGGPEVPLLSYPVHQARLIPFLAENYALGAFGEEVKLMWNKREKKERTVFVAALKYAATEHGMATLRQCRHCCGAQGILLHNIIGKLNVDVDVMATLDGDQQLLLQQISGYSLKSLGKSFAGVSGALGYFGQIVSSYVEANPLSSRNTSLLHLMDSSFHQASLQYKEYHLARSIASRISKLTAKGVSYFDAWNTCGLEVAELGRAFVTRRVHQSLLSKVLELEAEKSSLAPTLRKILSLYAVWKISQDKWFLEHDYISPSKARALTRLLASLVEDVTKDALPLVLSWALPAAIFQGTIGEANWPRSQTVPPARL